jgi:hypothetical protein
MHPAYFQTRFRTDRPVPSWPREFAIVTAWATTGETWPAEQNALADERLRTTLAARGAWYERITGYSPLDGHAEPGWAAELPVGAARALGADFAQDAIYWVRGDELYVTACAADAALERVSLFSARLDAPLGG